jgi:hypothetical protein
MIARDYIDVLSQPEDAVTEAKRVKAAKALRVMAPNAVAASKALMTTVATEAVLRALGLK